MAARVRSGRNSAEATAPVTAGSAVARASTESKQRALVLLEVAVVAARQSLHQGDERHQISGQTPRLTPREFRDIGISLLRHQRRSGAVCVRQSEEAELKRGEEHQILTEPRQVHTDQRTRVREIERPIPVSDRIYAVLARAPEA